MADDVLLLVLPESGAALLVWPDGRAVRVRQDRAVIGQAKTTTAIVDTRKFE